MLTRRWGQAVLILLLTLLITRHFSAALAQEEGPHLQIISLDVSDFPTIALRLLATDDDGNVIEDLSDLELRENGRQIIDFDIEAQKIGGDIVFIIDANDTIDSVDQTGGLTRLEKVRESIIRYANFYMDPTQKDRVSIIVPADTGSQPLDNDGLTFPNEVINAANLYQPEQLGNTPLQRMMELGFRQMEAIPSEGRSRSLVLFTDGARLGEQLDYDLLIERANEVGAAVYGLILGSRADVDEINNLQLLTAPSGGTIRHMPEAEAADDLFSVIDERSTQQQITYQSKISAPGRQSVEISLDSEAVQSAFELDVLPPNVSVAIDNSKPIRRVADELDTPLELMEPLIQPLVAQIDWPDGYPRKLESALLLVNGEEVPIEAPVLGSDGVLTFDWNIRSVDQGFYELQIEVIDELGLQGSSSVVPLAVEVDRPPEPLPTLTAAPAPTLAPPPAPIVPLPAEADEDLVLLGAGIFFLAFFGLLVVLFSIFFTRRRRSAPASAAPLAASTAGDYDRNVTYVVSPEIKPEDIKTAYFEALEHVPEHAAVIPLTGKNITLGRDPQVAQIPFNDRSVSRLHARILESDGSYRIYDEGSSSGTYVNYERIGLAPRILKDKDEVHFGRVHLRFRSGEAGGQALEATIASPSLD